MNSVTSIPINKLHPFKGHPYKVVDNTEMNNLAESIQENGILTPLLIRPLEGTTDEYEKQDKLNSAALHPAGPSGLSDGKHLQQADPELLPARQCS